MEVQGIGGVREGEEYWRHEVQEHDMSCPYLNDSKFRYIHQDPLYSHVQPSTGHYSLVTKTTPTNPAPEWIDSPGFISV
jgi:hypothetical protein